MMALTGARLVHIQVDTHGLCIDNLAALAEQERIRAVFVTPHHQFPTTVTLAPARRLRLLELARRYRFAIIEDDFDHESHCEGRPILPLASADTAGTVIYVGTLSKTLAPGLRLGYCGRPAAGDCAPNEVPHAAGHARGTTSSRRRSPSCSKMAKFRPRTPPAADLPRTSRRDDLAPVD